MWYFQGSETIGNLAKTARINFRTLFNQEKVAEYKINIQKVVVFLNTNNEL